MFRWLRALFAPPALGRDDAPSITEGGVPSATRYDPQDWLRRMPPRVLAVDVETTGIENTDRIVSFGGILLETALLARSPCKITFDHLIFNPGKNNHPMAEKVHGYSDWTLQHQETFAEEVESICGLIEAADLIIAHNAEFDIGFLNREFVATGRPAIKKPTYCTMTEWRRRAMPGSASLTNVAAFFGFSRASESHGALEDAWLALMIYLRFCGCPAKFPFSAFNNHGPGNFRPAPPEPWQSMLKAHPVRAIAAAKREGHYKEAEAWLLQEAERREAEARPNNSPASPWVHEQLAVLYRQQNRPADEIAIITRYLSLPGADSPAVSTAVRRLQERLEKAAKRLNGTLTHSAPAPQLTRET